MKIRIEKVVDFLKRNKDKIEIIILVTILVLLAIIVGLKRIKYSNFYPINGDFQNYNPIRRLLSGEIPYKDFAVYLGTGHLFLLSAIQLLIGNNYTLSLFVTNMTTLFAFELTLFVVSILILKNKKRALYTTIGITVISIITPEILNYVLINNIIKPEILVFFVKYEFWDTIVNFATVPGNSARLIRIAIAPIITLLIYIGIKFLDKSKKEFIIKHCSILKKILVSVLAGISILWSNDGGIATYITVSFMYFLLLIKEYKKDIKSILKYTFFYIGISLFSFLLLLTIVTRGDILSWFQFTLGTGSYQKWYYGEAPSRANFSLSQIDTSIYMLIMIGIAIYYIYKLFKSDNQKAIIRYALLDIMIITPIVCANLYQFLSGSYSKNMLYLVFMIVVSCYLIQFCLNRKKCKTVNRVVKILVIASSLILILNQAKVQLLNVKNEQKENGIYIEQLGGYFSKLGDSIQCAIERVGNDKIFSTYASAVDVATNQKQPTGVDYIIHCLGDKQRENYLEVFRKADFKYVVTTDRDYNSFRYWIKNANWFFYRELYQNYKPEFATEYSVFWVKNNKENNLMDIKNSTEITKTKKDNSLYQIEVNTRKSRLQWNCRRKIMLYFSANKKLL